MASTYTISTGLVGFQCRTAAVRGTRRSLPPSMPSKRHTVCRAKVGQVQISATKALRPVLSCKGTQEAKGPSPGPVSAVESSLYTTSRAQGDSVRDLVISAAAFLAFAGVFTQPALAENVADIIDGAEAAGGLQDGFISAFLLIFFSEIGDKTFFIAVLLALQQPKSAVFAGTFGALAVMSFISVALGEVFHQIDEGLHDFLPPVLAAQPLDDYAAVILLVIFGVTTIKEASIPKADEEREDAEEEVTKFMADSKNKELAKLILSTFFLVFAAEWGDKSFLATIALAAASSPEGVVTGAIAGHGVATGIAVSGGSLLGGFISEEVVAYAGGSLFLVFAAGTVLDIISKTS